MDLVAAQKEVTIPEIFTYTRNAFVPHLEEHRTEIESIKRKTFRYGETDRHQLDVYYPPPVLETGKVPILFFVYGGGFVGGERAFPPPYDLGYINVGSFFAKRGFMTVIPDYRLVPHVKFPEPVEDVRDAIGWVVKNAEVVGNGDVQGDFHNLFIMSHSAGSAYVSSLMLYPGILPQDLRSCIRGLILKGGAYAFTPELPSADPDVLYLLYGTWQEVHDKMPLTLLQRAPSAIVESFPEVLMMASEREPADIMAGNKQFVEALGEKLGRDVTLSLMKEHNHISPHWALGSGQGEDWAAQVEKWIKDNIRSE